MGIHADLFWPQVALAAFFQVAAFLLWLRGRPYLAWSVQFGAANSLMAAGLEAQRLWVLLLAAALYAPMVVGPCRVVRDRRAGLGLAFAVVAVGVFLIVGFAREWSDPDFRGKPVIMDRWSSSSPVHATRPSLMLKPSWNRGRCLDWGGELRFDCPLVGGYGGVEVVVENAGPVDSWQVTEGTVDVRAGARSRMRLRLDFPPEGGACAIAPVRRDQASCSILVVGGADGDLDALERLLDLVREDPPDLIAVLGNMCAPGDYPGLLAVRDLLDEVGTRVFFTPGPNEAADDWASGYEVVLKGRGMRERMVFHANLSGIVVDSTDGAVPEGRLTSLIFGAALGMHRGCSVAFLHHPLAGPAGRASALLPDAESRQQLLKRFAEWKVRLCVGVTPGEGWTFERDGMHHLAVGASDEALHGALLRLEDRTVAEMKALSVPRDAALGLGVEWRRLKGFAEEHEHSGEDLALGIAAVLAGLLGGVAALLRRPPPEPAS